MRNKMEISFLTSAVRPEHFPPADRPEIALVGRSNAGKSTLINLLSNRKVAKVSRVPGKTRLLNFFEAGERYRLVDMPGYGFAKRQEGERQLWREMVEAYL